MVEIVVENLVAGYGNVSVLHDVSIDVADKQTVALLGTNGNGKSTTSSTNASTTTTSCTKT